MPTDRILLLQSLARELAAALAPGVVVGWVEVYTADGRRLMTLPVPLLPCATHAPGGPPPPPEPPAVAPGWAVGPKGVLYDGARVAVAPSRLKLLRVLVEADGPLAAKELASMAFDRETDEGNARYHVGELRKELKAHFPDFEGDVIRPTGAGYELVLR